MFFEVTMTRIRTICDLATVEVEVEVEAEAEAEAEDEDDAVDEALALVDDDNWFDQGSEYGDPDILSVDAIGDEDDCEEEAELPTAPLAHPG